MAARRCNHRCERRKTARHEAQIKILVNVQRRDGLPFDSGHQEVQTALDLSAVYETVNVKSINGLSGWTSCAMASWKDDGEEQEKRLRHIKSAGTNQQWRKTDF